MFLSAPLFILNFHDAFVLTTFIHSRTNMKLSLWLCLWCFHDFLSLLASLFSKLNLRQLLWVLFVETFYSCLLSMQRGSVLCLFDIIGCKMSLTDYYAASYCFFLVRNHIWRAWFWQLYFYELIADSFYLCWEQSWG